MRNSEGRHLTNALASLKRLVPSPDTSHREKGHSAQMTATLTLDPARVHILIDALSRLDRTGMIEQAQKALLDELRAWNTESPQPAHEPKPDPHADLTDEQILAAIAGTDGLIDNMACPKCGHFEGGFLIHVTRSGMAYVDSQGVDFDGDYGTGEWNGSSGCRCCECNHLATVADFTLSDEALGRADRAETEATNA
jgi:hypothetical protein